MPVAINLESLLPAELPAGTLLRKPSGELCVVIGACAQQNESPVLVLYKDLTSGRGTLTVCSQDTLQMPGAPADTNKFAVVPGPTTGALDKFWKTHFYASPQGLQDLLSSYSEPWRFLHTERHLYRLFELAEQVGLPLTLEDGLALALYRIALVPGATEQSQFEQSVLVSKSFMDRISGAQVAWGLVLRHWDPQHKSPIRDLLLATLAASPLEFCVTEELGWLEHRHLYRGAEGRKEYDTERLKSLLTLAGKGALYSSIGESFEKRARVNIEGLRQAWKLRYAQ